MTSDSFREFNYLSPESLTEMMANVHVEFYSALAFKMTHDDVNVPGLIRHASVAYWMRVLHARCEK